MTQQLTSPPRILLADDDPKIGDAVAKLLASSCEFVGRVADLAALLSAVTELRPDVVLLDFSLADANPFELCRRLNAMAPAVKLIAFSVEDDPEIQRAAIDAGASAFVWKLRAARDLVNTIQAITAPPESDVCCDTM